MKTLPQELLDKIAIAKKQMSDQLDETGENCDHKPIARIADRVKDEVCEIIHRGITEMKDLDIPSSAKRGAFLNIGASAVASAVGVLSMATMSEADLRKTNSPDEMTRDHMLFAALFAIANETITDEGKKFVVEMAAKFAAGDQRALPGALAHHWFDMIRGYRFKSSGICAG